jgi:hypothetical protein
MAVWNEFGEILDFNEGPRRPRNPAPAAEPRVLRPPLRHRRPVPAVIWLITALVCLFVLSLANRGTPASTLIRAHPQTEFSSSGTPPIAVSSGPAPVAPQTPYSPGQTRALSGPIVVAAPAADATATFVAPAEREPNVPETAGQDYFDMLERTYMESMTVER